MNRQKVYCIFKKLLGGAVQIQRDATGSPKVYSTREEAEREIAKSVVTRIIQHFGHDYGDSGDSGEGKMTVRDYFRPFRPKSR